MWFKSEKLLWSGFAVAMVGSVIEEYSAITHSEPLAILSVVMILIGIPPMLCAVHLGSRGK